MERDMNDDLFRRVAEAQDELLERVSTVDREVRRIAERPAPRARRAWLVAPVLLTAAGAAAAFALVALGRPLTVERTDVAAAVSVGADVVAPAERPVALAFSDGSTMELGATARARVTRLNAHGAAIRVERGRAAISVVPRRGNDWGVDVGPFHVAVKGTRFSLRWEPETERFSFELEHGKVVITSPCLAGERALVAGESLEASCRWQPADRPPVAAAASAPAPVAAPPVEVMAPEVAPVDEPAEAPRVRVSERAPAWRKLASAQRYGEALAAAERGGFAAECRRRDAADLLLLGDVARLAGSPARAAQAYEAARRKRGATPDRSAFGLGLVAFDQRRDYRAAAAWFQTYLREQPRGALAEQAEGRLMDAWQRAGEGARAREAARGYLARYPHGAYGDLARRLAQR
jgi:hypothetical protein